MSKCGISIPFKKGHWSVSVDISWYYLVAALCRSRNQMSKYYNYVMVDPLLDETSVSVAFLWEVALEVCKD